MFDYNKISYSNKIIQLLDYHGSQAKLSDYLEVSRQSILNWKEDDSSLKEENKTKIDIAYCQAFGFEAINTDEIIRILTQLQKINFSYFNQTEEDIVSSISRISAFGSLEIEESSITEKKFNKVIIENELINNLDMRELFSIKNLAALSNKVIKDAIKYKVFPITSNKIKDWHFNLMSGIRADAGDYSTKIRIIPGIEDLHLTNPRDIPNEMEYWCNKYEKVSSLQEIAQAHAHFEAIHPFGDGNGRLGRIIMTAQCINIGLIPPLINKKNKALYLVFLKHAQINSEYGHLTYFLAKSILDTHCKVCGRKYKN